MAEYRDQDFAALGARVVALSVDDARRAEAMRAQLKLPFVVLCDTRRAVITEWGVLNAKENGGIAYPSVFVLDRERTVRYRSLDRTATRVSTESVVAFLRGGMPEPPKEPARRSVWPGLLAWTSAVGNALRHGVRVPRK